MANWRKRYCKQCCRKDIHKAVRFPIFLEAILVLLTLGLVILIWPERCACCGTVRIT